MKSIKSKRSQVTSSQREFTSSTQNASQLRPKLLEKLFGLFTSIFLVSSIFAIPEGNTRDGDYLPIALLFFLFGVGITLLVYKKYNQINNIDDSQDTFPSIKNKFIPIADYSLLFFTILITISYLRVVIFKLGDVRFSSNTYWTVITPITFYYFLRFYKNFISQKLVIGLLSLIFVCGIAESVYSIYSYAVINPQLRESYRQNPEQMLKDANLNFSADSRERELFEKRLLDSSEPSGSYGLANTLAGFLVPVFILGLTLILSKTEKLLFFWKKDNNVQDFTFKNFRILLFILGFVTIIFAMILTKSRAGFLSAIVGSLLLFLWLGFHASIQKSKITRKSVILAIGVFLGLTILVPAIACFTGQLDREVFTEAGKSLGYRLDYWMSTSLMIRDHLILGIGPGEFQNIYPQYILPTASEFIADPHNFIFEIAALFGLPALIAFLVFVFSITAIVICDLQRPTTSVNSLEQRNISLPKNKGKTSVLLCGAYFGLVLLVLCSPFQETPIDFQFLSSSLIVCLALLPISQEFERSFTDPHSNQTTIIIITMMLALLLNLCVAGGILYPVISVSLFFLAAIVANQTFVSSSNTGINTYFPSLKKVKLFLLTWLIILCVFYITAFKPRCNSFLFSLQYDPQNISASPYLAALNNGSFQKIDKASVPVAEQFYFFAGLEYVQSRADVNQERWTQTRLHILKVSPHSSTMHERCGDFDMTLYKRQPETNQDFLDSAFEFYQKAVDLSPTDANKRVKLFRTLLLKKDYNKAISEAQTALELDNITEHEDRKLPAEDREELVTFLTTHHDSVM